MRPAVSAMRHRSRGRRVGERVSARPLAPCPWPGQHPRLRGGCSAVRLSSEPQRRSDKPGRCRRSCPRVASRVASNRRVRRDSDRGPTEVDTFVDGCTLCRRKVHRVCTWRVTTYISDIRTASREGARRGEHLCFESANVQRAVLAARGGPEIFDLLGEAWIRRCLGSRARWSHEVLLFGASQPKSLRGDAANRHRVTRDCVNVFSVITLSYEDRLAVAPKWRCPKVLAATGKSDPTSGR